MKENQFDNVEEIAGSDTPACDSLLTRQEFLSRLTKAALATGTLLVAPKVVDKFLVPPAHAATSNQKMTKTTLDWPYGK